MKVQVTNGHISSIQQEVYNGIARTRHRGHRRSPRRHFRNQQRAAVVRAITAAKIYTDGMLPTLAAAAIACGSCPPYVAAAVTLLKSGNTALLDRVLRGAMPLLAAAREAERVAHLVAAYRAATADDLVTFTRIVGPTKLWDDAIAPVI